MQGKEDEVPWDTYLQITETGKKRIRRMEQRYVLRTLMEQLPIVDAVFSILNRMDNGDIMTVQQLVDFYDKGAKQDDNLTMTPMAIFARKRASQISLRAIKRCIKKGYLARSLAPGILVDEQEQNTP